MRFRDRLTFDVAPLFLRLALGVVFIWAGSGKVFFTSQVSGEPAAALANLGIIDPPAGAQSDSPGEGGAAAGAEAPPAQPVDAPDATGGVTFTLPRSQGSARAPLPTYTPADFPEPIEVSRRHTSISLLIYQRASAGEGGGQLWPSGLASPGVVRTLAWVEPLTELVGGFLVLMGFLTRLWALGLAMAMAGALLLTTVGPAAVGDGAFLGFLPQPRMSESEAWVAAWTPMLFQFTLLMMALALASSGAGALSFDRLVIGSRGGAGKAFSEDDEDEEDE